MIRFPNPEFVETNGIRLSTHISGDGDAVVLCHGFPEIAFSWRHQVAPLTAAGYRAIMPNQRGFAASEQPAAVTDYDIIHLVDDMCGLLDSLDLAQAVFVGHDWGALMLWQMALLRPQRMRGLVALNIPFAPRRDIDPMVMMRQMLGDDFYIVNFNDSDEADHAFEADTERFLRAMYRRLPITRAAFDALQQDQRQAFSMLREMRKDRLPGSALLSEEELAVFVTAFRHSGFTPAINWYRNWSRNWTLTEGLSQQVRIPVLFVGANDDILIAPSHIETMRRYVDDLEVHSIDQCGHWTQQEQPERFNALLIDWLSRRFPPGSAAD